MCTKQEFLNTIKNVCGSRKHKIKNSYGVNDAFKYYRKNRSKNAKRLLDESDYFAIRGEIEAAKLNVLRSYPYMNEFIERGMQENQIDVIEETEAAKNQYMEQMDRYFAQAKDEKWRKGISREFVDNLIRYCIDGLTRDQMDAGSYQPELLSSQISEYMNTIKRMAIIS